MIEPVRASRVGWFDGYRADQDEDVWQDLPPTSDSGEWEWQSLAPGCAGGMFIG